MEGQSSIFCSVFEKDSARDARLCIARLQENPIPIWWYRRRVQPREGADRKGDLSPFPKSWSLNYSPETATEFREKIGVPVDEDAKEEQDWPICATNTDESSMYSTESQEKRHQQEQLRSENGNCIRHPSIKLAEKKHVRKLSNFFGKYKRQSSSGEYHAADEWAILLEECPECKLESLSNSKLRSRSKASFETKSCVSYKPFSATITIVESHAHLPVGSLALQIRTDPIPIEQTRHLSCVFDDDNKEEYALWTTPDGALDFLLPCDSKGNLQSSDTNPDDESTSSQDEPLYQIMERVIPLYSIDHISRGGDAWDVLRHGDKDMGCRCDLKIHGFADILLRFDVISFGQDNNSNRARKTRHSFAVVDFLRSSVSHTKEIHEQKRDLTEDDQWELGNYTSENVIMRVNSLIMWDRDRRETGTEGWADCFATCLEEYLSLGVPSAGKKFVLVEKKRKTSA